MKHIIISTALVFASILGYAQSTNPLNYSGRMYIEAIEICATPRYISYEDYLKLIGSEIILEQRVWVQIVLHHLLIAVGNGDVDIAEDDAQSVDHLHLRHVDHIAAVRAQKVGRGKMLL